MAQRIINTQRNSEQQQDLNRFKQMLVKSRYPRQLIEKTILKCLQKSNHQLESNELDNKQKAETKLSLSLSYVKGMEVLERKLEKIGIKPYSGYPLE